MYIFVYFTKVLLFLLYAKSFCFSVGKEVGMYMYVFVHVVGGSGYACVCVVGWDGCTLESVCVWWEMMVV